MGIGRGDSALAYLTLAPAPAKVLEKSVRVIRALVRGDEVSFDELTDFQIPGLTHIDALALGHGVTSAKLGWRNPSTAPPPIEVSASGPRTIAFASRESDGVLLAVGAAPDRLRWAIDVARANGAARISAHLNVAVHKDIEVATRLARALVAPFARFSVMDGRVRAPFDDKDRQELVSLHGAYDMRGHASGAAAHASGLSAEFVRDFAVVGPPEECVHHIREIADLGIERVIVVGPADRENREDVAHSLALFNAEVLPHITSPRTTGTVGGQQPFREPR
ncbi:MAG: LLM class flavin-dependent oxidoreductase [Frankia sp.]